jgi:hypothetical protein
MEHIHVIITWQGNHIIWRRNDVGMQEKCGVWKSQWDGRCQEETFLKGIYGRR